MSDQQTYVPDGDPCPKAGHHDQPTKLVHVAGAGLFSQCIICRDEFFTWYGSAAQQRPESVEPPLLPAESRSSLRHPKGGSYARPTAPMLPL